jgi:hypothetical protein
MKGVPLLGNFFGGGKKKPVAEPATDKQKKFAGKLGIKNPDSLSKEGASVEIDKKLTARANSRKGWISSIEARVEALEKKVIRKSVRKAAKKSRKTRKE